MTSLSIEGQSIHLSGSLGRHGENVQRSRLEISIWDVKYFLMRVDFDVLERH